MDRHVDCRTGVKPVVGGLRSRYTFFLRNLRSTMVLPAVECDTVWT